MNQGIRCRDGFATDSLHRHSVCVSRGFWSRARSTRENAAKSRGIGGFGSGGSNRRRLLPAQLAATERDRLERRIRRLDGPPAGSNSSHFGFVYWVSIKIYETDRRFELEFELNLRVDLARRSRSAPLVGRRLPRTAALRTHPLGYLAERRVRPFVVDRETRRQLNVFYSKGEAPAEAILRQY